MNTHPECRRHSYRTAAASYSPDVDQADRGAIESANQWGSQLAHHADPSLPSTPPLAQTSKRVAWVRPTEVPSYAGPLIGRGVDLQAELIRRARRSPVTATRAARRHLRQTTPTERTAPREQGIGL